MDPQELGFTPQPPVGWLAPFLLLSTGVRTLLALLFGAYLDKRELQNALAGDIHRQPGTGGEIWVDYVADLGDGFDATYSVAYLLAQPRLTVDGRRLPRGQVLLMGGDQVYPTASAEAYEDRCKGPYQAALPCPPRDGHRPTLFTLPGNHDWYDGLTAFLRLFARRRDGNIGGWRTEQRRSYFAVELPADWWVFAIDEQFGAYLDDPQLIYFERAAAELTAEDRVILMVPAPTWVKAVDKPGAYDAVDYFIRTIIAPTGARARLLVSGDLHHYARYAGPDRQLVTCGGGGAYLHPTHVLPEKLPVPPNDTLSRRASVSHDYALAARYPDAARSRRYGWSVFWRLPLRNPGFATLLGTTHTLLMLAIAAATTRGGDIQRLFTIPLVMLLLIVMGGAVLFANPPSASGKRHTRHWLLGLGHGMAHVALAGAGAWLWQELPFQEWSWPMPLVVAAVGYGPLAGFLATQLTAWYLLGASWFGVNTNELFAGQGIDDAKSFLRMHVAADGTLTVYPIAVDHICRAWRADPYGAADSSWLVPERSAPPVRLAEAPFTLR
ncbi:MAG TPA: metallophosphoesterase [Catenuloplanes sp.]